VWASSPSGSKNFGIYLGWVAEKVWWGGVLSPLSLPPHKQPEDLLFWGRRRRRRRRGTGS